MKRPTTMKVIIVVVLVALIGAFTTGWKQLSNSHNSDETETDTAMVAKPLGPKFDADSAYTFCAAQCAFGERVMNSPAHEKCGQWIVDKFKQYGCEVTEQKVDLKGYDGTVLKATNIIAQYNPKAKRRVMLCAHWDARPWADNDPDSTKHHMPVMAANDGASGVAVLLEVARQLNLMATSKGKEAEALPRDLGVDFVCFDAEDWGLPQWVTDYQGQDETWALGAQYFSKNYPLPAKPMFSVLVDMVGGEGAQFYREGMSVEYASDVVNRVWQAAKNAGFANYFPDEQGGMVTDDHIPLNQNAGIPTADVIAYYPDCQQSSFGPTWHTVSDTMDHIDRNTLEAVGQTMIQMLWEI